MKLVQKMKTITKQALRHPQFPIEKYEEILNKIETRASRGFSYYEYYCQEKDLRSQMRADIIDQFIYRDYKLIFEELKKEGFIVWSNLYDKGQFWQDPDDIYIKIIW